MAKEEKKVFFTAEESMGLEEAFMHARSWTQHSQPANEQGMMNLIALKANLIAKITEVNKENINFQKK